MCYGIGFVVHENRESYYCLQCSLHVNVNKRDLHVLRCMSNAVVIICHSWYTTMLGKKSSLAPVLAFLKENGVGLLTLFRNCV